MTSRFPLKAALGALALTVSGAFAADLPPLSENKFINDWLLAASVGDEIRKNCPTISPRLLRVYYKAKELEDHATKLGYSDEQTDTYINSPADRDKIKAKRDAYLKAKDAVVGNADGYCRLGMQEIEKNTQVGWLLYAK